MIRKALLERMYLCRFFDVSMPWLLKFIKNLYENLHENLNVQLTSQQKAALIVKKHLVGIKNWIKSKINNGILKGLNSIVQASKIKARFYGKKHFATIALLLTGKLDFTKINPLLPTRFSVERVSPKDRFLRLFSYLPKTSFLASFLSHFVVS
jgi:hypothetical protein